VFRCINTLNPFSPTYTSAHLTPTPDLYGPFWTLTTLIFTLFVTSSLAHSIVSYLSSDAVEYDFALLSTAVGLVYAYGIGVPVMLWVALRYAGISENWAMVEAVTVWGYAMFVWIPVSVRDIVSVLAVPFSKSSRFRSSALFLSPFFAGFYPV
jgi:protein YIPF1/2